MELRARAKSMSWLSASKSSTTSDSLTARTSSTDSGTGRGTDLLRQSYRDEAELLSMPMGILKRRLCRLKQTRWNAESERSVPDMNEEDEVKEDEASCTEQLEQATNLDRVESRVDESATLGETDFFWLKGFNLYEVVEPCSQSTNFFFRLAQGMVKQDSRTGGSTPIWTHQRDANSSQICVIKPTVFAVESEYTARPKQPDLQAAEKRPNPRGHPPTMSFSSASNAQLRCVTIDECPEVRIPERNAHLVQLNSNMKYADVGQQVDGEGEPEWKQTYSPWKECSGASNKRVTQMVGLS